MSRDRARAERKKARKDKKAKAVFLATLQSHNGVLTEDLLNQAARIAASASRKEV